MTATHTPGPYWYATEEVGFAVGAGDREIAFVATCGTFTGGEGRANARLFHAAPDMLAALEHLRTIAATAILHRTSLDHQGLIELFEEAREAAFAAIAKATGP